MPSPTLVLRRSTIKILFLDIETAPNTCFTWGLFKQNVSIDQIVKPGYTLCWAAKWLGEEEVMFDSIYQSSPKKMLRRIHKLMDEADAVVHYNGTKFDIPTLNKEFLLHGLSRPSGVQQIDLLKTVRKQFRLASNKLDFVARELGLAGKEKHKGFGLWSECMRKDPDAWEVMERYNKQDVLLLEDVYWKLLPWITGHPNMSVYYEEVVCPHCGSNALKKNGTEMTRAGKYQRYKCKDCGSPARGNKNLFVGEKLMEVV